jgi:hypothetical protein
MWIGACRFTPWEAEVVSRCWRKFSAGELIVYDCAIPHQVEALEESAFLLTISWPEGQRKNAMHGRTWCHDALRGTTILFICFASLSSLIALRCSCVAQGPAKQDSTPPNELVRRVVENELKTEQEDHSHWSFRETIKKPNGRTEVDKVVETTSGDLKLPIQIDGHELTASERKKSEKQLGRNPQALRKSLQDKDQDTERSQRMLQMLPDAFNFSYVGRLGDLVQLSFTPSPKFHPSSHEAEVFHAMETPNQPAIDSKRVNGRTNRKNRCKEAQFATKLLPKFRTISQVGSRADLWGISPFF